MEVLNRAQLLKGVKNDGRQLSAYTPAYAKKKGKPRRPKTLKDTGAFHDAFYNKAFERYIEFGSKDSKADILSDDENTSWGYGEDIFGLTEQNWNDILKRVSALMVQMITHDLTRW